MTVQGWARWSLYLLSDLLYTPIDADIRGCMRLGMRLREGLTDDDSLITIGGVVVIPACAVVPAEADATEVSWAFPPWSRAAVPGPPSAVSQVPFVSPTPSTCDWDPL
jgi:hypothetical protein